MKRLLITLTAIALFGALSSAARAQTTNYSPKWNGHANHSSTVPRYGSTTPTTSGLPNYMTNANYGNLANKYNAAYGAYQAKYQKDLATYENYLATHPGIAQTTPYGMPYGTSYPTYGAYTNPMMQQLSSIPILSSLAPMLGSGGGYGGGMPMGMPMTTAMPMTMPMTMPYATASYPYSGASYPYAGVPYAQAAHHHHWFGNGNYGGSGPLGIGYQAMHHGGGNGFFAPRHFAAASQAHWRHNH